MALPSCAAAGRPVTSPRAAIDPASAAAVAAASAVACTWPTLANSSADPVYSGTSCTRPAISAGSTSSRVPRPGSTRTRYPRPASTPAYRSASSTLSGKLNDPTVITAPPPGPPAAPGGGPAAAVPPAHATASTTHAARPTAPSSGIPHTPRAKPSSLQYLLSAPIPEQPRAPNYPPRRPRAAPGRPPRGDVVGASPGARHADRMGRPAGHVSETDPSALAKVPPWIRMLHVGTESRHVPRPWRDRCRCWQP